MEKGRLLQVGSPRDLYERPDNRAVAGFFGHMNLWDGTVSTGDTVTCAVGAVSAATSLPAGTPVALAVRPEQIVLHAAGATPDSGQLAGTIADVVYGGTVSTYFVAHGATRIRVVRQNGAGPALERGQAVVLSWPVSAVRVLPS